MKNKLLFLLLAAIVCTNLVANKEVTDEEWPRPTDEEWPRPTDDEPIGDAELNVV